MTKCAESASNLKTVALTCASGMYISSIEFASFGNPSGDCGSYSTGSCHSPASKAMIEKQCLYRKNCYVLAKRIILKCSVNSRLVVQFNCTQEAVLEESSQATVMEKKVMLHVSKRQKNLKLELKLAQYLPQIQMPTMILHLPL